MLRCKSHITEKGRLLAVCDEEIIGLTFREGPARITVSERFYGGELVTEEEFVERSRSAVVMNIVGNRAVEAAVAAGLASERCVISIGGVKHAQTVVL
ncbi:MAG: DUF424 family protein [Candidatus Methanoplasma sp.]|jgi:hypothetical protein|nr:DUF424 family protein [Candidatus Methanoplasma sp.]